MHSELHPQKGTFGIPRTSCMHMRMRMQRRAWPGLQNALADVAARPIKIRVAPAPGRGPSSRCRYLQGAPAAGAGARVRLVEDASRTAPPPGRRGGVRAFRAAPAPKEAPTGPRGALQMITVHKCHNVCIRRRLPGNTNTFTDESGTGASAISGLCSQIRAVTAYKRSVQT